MKKNYLILILLISFGAKSQNINLLNKDLNLSDTLNYAKEIRVYLGTGITNYSSVFRMFNYKGNEWRAEFYEHYAEIPNETQLKIKKKNLKPKNDFEFVFLNFLKSKVLNLPDQKEIEWKIRGRDSIFKTKRKWKGKDFVKYESIANVINILDGVSYKVQVRDLSETNEFFYYNPESYLEKYKDIDELIFMSEILNIVRDEFKIWKN